MTKRLLTVKIAGIRFVSRTALEDDPEAMTKTAEELLELLQFQLDCFTSYETVDRFVVTTGRADWQLDNIWTRLTGTVKVELEPGEQQDEEIVL